MQYINHLKAYKYVASYKSESLNLASYSCNYVYLAISKQRLSDSFALIITMQCLCLLLFTHAYTYVCM